LLDPVLCGIFTHRLLYYLGRDTLFSNKLSRWFFHAINVIPIKRRKPSSTGIKTGIKKLKAGNGLCVFPEGTRSPDGRIAPFMSGFSLLCRLTKATIVPVLIDGAVERWPRHSKIIKPGRIFICFYTAIPPDQIKNMSDKELSSMLENTLKCLQTKIRIKNGKQPFRYVRGDIHTLI
jgi:1-acyl-sn-glycerol-3-phosphate acyltransferase